MKFGFTILYVKDAVKSVEFYEGAFGLKRRFIHESQQYAELETGATAIAFATNEFINALLPGGFRPNRVDDRPAGFEIVFQPESVTAAYQQALKFGAVSVAEPKLQPWGWITAFVRDLDGILIELAQEDATFEHQVVRD